MNSNIIVIDGKTYHSVDEMPAEVRARYEQAAASLRREAPQASQPAPSASILTSGMKFVVDGKEYNRIEDLPPEARAKYEQAMSMLDKNRNGTPDILEGMLGMSSPPPAQAGTAVSPSPRRASRPPTPASPAIAPDTANGWMLVLLGGFLAVLCLLLAAGIWYFFLR
ncbi:MAG: hypothetical protein AB1509_04935 [Chloroflexota bacterium]